MKNLLIGLILTFSSTLLYSQADFSASRRTTCPGVAINFTDNSVSPASWSWQFDGGVPNSSNAQNPGGIVYNTVGNHDVTLTVNGDSTTTKTEYIRVINCKVSTGIYRIPYANGTTVEVGRDHLTHSPSPVRIDMNGTGGGPYSIVAAADGIIQWIVDGNSECCSSVSGCSDCNNYVWIAHPNGEWTKYTHFMTGTVTGAGFANLSPGDTICAGTFLGFEGDVGASSGGGRAASACNAVSSVQTVLDSLNAVRINNGSDSIRCGQHLHFEVAVPNDLTDPFDTLGGFINGSNRIPMVCGIGDNIFKDDTISVAAQCVGTTCVDSLMLSNETFGLQDITLRQADVYILAENGFDVKANSNVVLSAGQRIVLKNGFSADGGSNFRARIGSCNRSTGSIKCSSKTGGSFETTYFEEKSTSSFSVYPNPFYTEITLTFETKRSAIISASLFNLQGQEVMRIIDMQKFDDDSKESMNVNVESLPAGTYFCHYSDGNSIAIQKLIKVY